ncbi:uncharacterized protein LOC111717432 [Eurytemora carolleeae]|uniref:uncharacterized protein LOC111717432 n=1 Tax=Eurytemora carolleeae TaxID=1294199 RepID=UPI000C75B989|nr:uncharacterized protein LOC111717432 [Eurytemora carolleeae]|eukprot:XP_023348704.1 uncharacterized protein LOC111717432 [Eurytemora affinis]
MTELNGLQTLLGMYQKLLRNHPIPTKSLTSAIIAGLGSNLYQVTILERGGSSGSNLSQVTILERGGSSGSNLSQVTILEGGGSSGSNLSIGNNTRRRRIKWIQPLNR